MDQLKIHLPEPLAAPPKCVFLKKTSNTIKVGYFGKLEILDNQAAFAGLFVDKPTILAPNPVMLQNNTMADRSLYYFGKKYKLDVFMNMCRRYYVVHDSVENSLSVKEMCL